MRMDLKGRDLNAVLEFLQEASSVNDPAALARYFATELQHIIAADRISYNEIDASARRIAWVRVPATTFDGAEQTFARLMMQHPVIAHRSRTSSGEALKISDFLTRHEFHETALYNEYFRQVKTEYQLSVAWALSGPEYIAVALSRMSADFSRYEKALLNHLRPHLVQIHRNVETLARLRSSVSLMSRSLEQVGQGIIVLGKRDRIESATPSARRWLAHYFINRDEVDVLPEVLERWIRQGESTMAADSIQSTRPPEPFIVEVDGRTLFVRVLAETTKKLLLLSERIVKVDTNTFETLGLSHREAEVLGWIVEGKTTPAIAGLLGVSVRTVQHHLDRIYRKLRVESRTAAAARAFRLMHGSTVADDDRMMMPLSTPDHSPPECRPESSQAPNTRLVRH